MRSFRGFAVVLLLAAAAHAQTIVSEQWNPTAVRTTRAESVTLDLVTSGAVSGVRVDTAAGSSFPMTLTAPNHWTASIPAAQVLAGYTRDNVNHNFVGYIRLLGGAGQPLATYNGFVNVIDDRVHPAAARDLGGGGRATERVLNLYRPAIGLDDVKTAVQQFYGYFHDDFDFVQVVFSLPSYPANRYHFPTRNDVSGIGLQIYNNSPLYGSAGKLQGVTVYPVDFFFDAGEAAFSHELAHQWIMFLKNPSLQPGPHWPPSTMGRGIMGINIPGSGVGGQFPWSVTPVTSTAAKTLAAPVTNEFSDFDLYLMGFIPPSAVAPGTVIQGSACEGCVLPSSPITAADVIGVNGPRIPSSASAQKSFRVATVVISQLRPLNPDEMSLFEYFAERGEATIPLFYTSGFVRGLTNPFYVATRGIGRVDFHLEERPRRRTVRH